MKNITNVYEAVDSNRLKSVLVIGFFIVFTVGVVFLIQQAFGFGYWLVGVALVITGLMSIGSYWFSDRIVLSISGARPASRKRDFHFYTVAENLSMAAGLPMPKLYVIEDPAPNAFATGRDPKHAVICATRGLLETLDRTELEGVISHELSHIGNRDTLVMGIVAVLAGSVVILTDFAMRMLWFGGRDSDNKQQNALIMLLGIVVIILAPIIAQLIQLAVSRRREFLADATGAKLTRFPEGLARALEKIASYPEPMKNVSNATAHLFIENPLHADSSKKTNWLVKLFNTHPPVEERIAALRKMV